MKADRGFSLLEVMVALAVIAVAMVALVEAGTQEARTRGALTETALATWVAANAIETLRAEESWPAVGERQGQARMGQRDWYWRMVISQTEESRIRRLDVRVFESAEVESSIATVSGFVGQE